MYNKDVIMESKKRYVKYIAGAGCMLHKPLSDGQMSFNKGIVYTLATYSDLVRLTSTGDFIEVDAKGNLYVAPVKKEVVEEKIEEVFFEVPKKKNKELQESKGENN